MKAGGRANNMKGKIGFVVCVCALILHSVPATAVLEVPEGAVTFESLDLSGTYDADAIKCQTKEVTLRFAEPSDVKIILYTYRRSWGFYVTIYVDSLLATEEYIHSDNQAETIIIPGAFIKAGENTIRLEFTSSYKFSIFPLSIAPKSYVVSTNAPEIVPPAKAPTPVSSPIPSPTVIPTPTATPITSPGQIPTPMPRAPGFEVLFALVAVLLVSLLTRQRRAK